MNNTLTKYILLLAMLSFGPCLLWAGEEPQRKTNARLQQGPPPQALQDCLGKNAGDKVLHNTPEGKVDATCVETPQGLAARPLQSPSTSDVGLEMRSSPEQREGRQQDALQDDSRPFPSLPQQQRNASAEPLLAPPPQTEARQQQGPPPRAFQDCLGKKAGDQVLHATPEGKVDAICVETPQGLAARPLQPRAPGKNGLEKPDPSGQARGRQGDLQDSRSSPTLAPSRRERPVEPLSRQVQRMSATNGDYSIEQALSDQAQRDTIAFNALAFITGDFRADTFLPPGKVSDYFGFQYMRDIDSGDKGHNTSFLTKIADNTLTILSDSQRAQLVALAREQEAGIRQFAEKRFPLIHAFRRNLEGNIPAGSKGLDRDAVKRASADLYELDGALAYGRAKVMGRILCELNAPQRNALARLKFGDSRSWPEVGSPLDKRSMSHVNHVAVMTYASEMFAWHAGSLDADIYFCPERHGMYFGGFGLKTAPAMGKPNFSISTGLTADRGESFLSMLTGTQQKFITDTVNEQRQLLHDIVRIRREIATQLRDFERCGSANWEKVRALSRKYGEIDGEISYLYATTFASIAKTLTNQQKASLSRLRPSNPSDPKGPFLYSEPIPMPRIDNTDFLFGVR